MNATDYRLYIRLKEGPVSDNSIPKSVQQSVEFKSLVNAKVIVRSKSGRGSVWQVIKLEAFTKFLQTFFPDALNPVSKSDNIKSFRNSKATRITTQPILFVRGFDTVEINGQKFDIGRYTNLYGLFSGRGLKINCAKICFVENLETFLHAERILGEAYLYVHSYGRLGTAALQQLQAEEFLVFVDFDYNGLDEFLRVRKTFPLCSLMIPAEFDTLFDRYSCEMKGNQAPSSAVQHSTDKDVVRLRELIARTNRFLEQEFLIP